MGVLFIPNLIVLLTWSVLSEMNKEGFMRLLLTKCCTFVSCIYQFVNLLEKEQRIIKASDTALMHLKLKSSLTHLLLPPSGAQGVTCVRLVLNCLEL